jgi:hypothetical protein
MDTRKIMEAGEMKSFFERKKVQPKSSPIQNYWVCRRMDEETLHILKASDSTLQTLCGEEFLNGFAMADRISFQNNRCKKCLKVAERESNNANNNNFNPGSVNSSGISNDGIPKKRKRRRPNT